LSAGCQPSHDALISSSIGTHMRVTGRGHAQGALSGEVEVEQPGRGAIAEDLTGPPAGSASSVLHVLADGRTTLKRRETGA
jgi:hypothetical protein